MSDPKVETKKVDEAKIREAVTRMLAREGFVATSMVLVQDETGIHALAEGHPQIKEAPKTVASGTPIGIGRR